MPMMLVCHIFTFRDRMGRHLIFLYMRDIYLNPISAILELRGAQKENADYENSVKKWLVDMIFSLSGFMGTW